MGSWPPPSLLHSSGAAVTKPKPRWTGCSSNTVSRHLRPRPALRCSGRRSVPHWCASENVSQVARGVASHEKRPPSPARSGPSAERRGSRVPSWGGNRIGSSREGGSNRVSYGLTVGAALSSDGRAWGNCVVTRRGWTDADHVPREASWEEHYRFWGFES